jgi:hypothetical protein
MIKKIISEIKTKLKGIQMQINTMDNTFRETADKKDEKP